MSALKSEHLFRSYKTTDKPLFIYIILYLNMNRESNIGFKKPWLGLIKSGMFGESHSYQQDMQPCCIQFLIIFTCNNKKKLE